MKNKTRGIETYTISVYWNVYSGIYNLFFMSINPVNYMVVAPLFKLCFTNVSYIPIVEDT